MELRTLDTTPDEPIRLETVPPPEADWEAIWRFADTFNGYKYWGSFKRCAEIANDHRDSTLTELRTCLFFEARRFQHFGDEPDGDEEHYIRELLAKIREKVAFHPPD
jgi:hypothetical protein